MLKPLLVAALALMTAPCAAQSQYPTKPIRMIVGFTPGSEIDVIGRMLSEKLSDTWGQRVVIDNRSGAGGTVAGAIAATAPADGYTLFFNSVSHTASSALYPKLSYDPQRDFAGVSQATSAPNVLIIAPSQGVKTAKELVATARQKSINYGHAGVGSGTHITGEMFRLALQLNVSHIPYKGVPEVLADTTTGRIFYSFTPIGNALPFVRDRRVVALAVTTSARSPMMPDIPTVSETVIPGFEWDQWYGMFAPAKTPRAIVEKLNHETLRVLQGAGLREKLSSLGVDPMVMTPDEFRLHVEKEIALNALLAKKAGLKAE